MNTLTTPNGNFEIDLTTQTANVYYIGNDNKQKLGELEYQGWNFIFKGIDFIGTSQHDFKGSVGEDLRCPSTTLTQIVEDVAFRSQVAFKRANDRIAKIAKYNPDFILDKPDSDAEIKDGYYFKFKDDAPADIIADFDPLKYDVSGDVANNLLIDAHDFLRQCRHENAKFVFVIYEDGIIDFRLKEAV